MNTLGKLIVCCSIFMLPLAQADESQDSLTERLIGLRGQVDEMQSELDIRREEHKNKMVYLSAQTAELEASRDREALRVEKMQKDLEVMRTEVAAGDVSSGVLLPVVRVKIEMLRKQIASGFPFKKLERQAELDELESQLNSGVITAQRGINRLWAFIEDEIRLSRENAIYSQSIMIDGQSMLVDIAKLGSVMMFFRSRDLNYGRAVYSESGWRFEWLESTAEQKQVAQLFDSLRKQIRQGYFELPAVLPSKSGEPS